MERKMNRIKNLVEKKLGNGYTVSIMEQEKNNGAVWHGLIISSNDAVKVRPVVYLDEYLTEIEAGRMTLPKAADSVVAAYRAGVMHQPVPGSLRIDRQTILDRTVYRLVNARMNAAGLAEVPHRDFLDLTAMYRIIFGGELYASTKVSRRMCEEFGITESELDAAARENTRRNGFEAKPLSEIISEMTGGLIPSETGLQVKVYTNLERLNGAAVMLYPDEFRAFAEEVGDDLYILPSSIHEVIAVPSHMMSKDELRNMVGAINVKEVADEEVLSNSVYRYSLETGTITIA